MRRTALLLTVLGLISTGLGCKHIGGKCDCQSNPADAVMPASTTPYSAMPIATVPATGNSMAPAPMAAPITPVPR